jgi:hypothetical protein
MRSGDDRNTRPSFDLALTLFFKVAEADRVLHSALRPIAICSRLNRCFMARTKSRLAPGTLSHRITRSVYETPLVPEIACLLLAFTRSTERGLDLTDHIQFAGKQSAQGQAGLRRKPT